MSNFEGPDKPMSKTEFKAKIQEEKHKRIENLSLLGNKFDTLKIKNHFKDKKINEIAIVDYFKKAGLSSTERGTVMGLNSETESSEKLLDIFQNFCIEKKLSNNDPIGLANNLESYLRGIFRYDLYSAIDQAFTQLESFKSNHKDLTGVEFDNGRAFQSLSEQEVKILNQAIKDGNQPIIWSFSTKIMINRKETLLNSSQCEQFGKICDYLIQNPEELDGFAFGGKLLLAHIKQLAVIFKTKSPEQIKEYLFKFRDAFSAVCFYGMNIGQEMGIGYKRSDTLYDYQSIDTIIQQTRVGVCRNFADIYSRYYNKLSNKLGLNSESSTVINGPKSHAYNVILYEQSGKLETKYYDLTKSSSQTGLTFRVKDIKPVTKENQKKQSTINNSNNTEKEKKPTPKYNGEIWVNNTQKSDSVDQQT